MHKHLKYIVFSSKGGRRAIQRGIFIESMRSSPGMLGTKQSAQHLGTGAAPENNALVAPAISINVAEVISDGRRTANFSFKPPHLTDLATNAHSTAQVEEIFDCRVLEGCARVSDGLEAGSTKCRTE
jgi:hypothetical protein